MHADGLLELYLGLIKEEMKGFVLEFEQERISQVAIAANAGTGVVDQGSQGVDVDVDAVTAKFEHIFNSAMGIGQIGQTCPTGEKVTKLKTALASLKSQISYNKTATRSPMQDCMIALSIADTYRAMWHTLGGTDRTTYMEKYAILYQVYANSMPLESACAIQEYLLSSWMELKSGLLNITHTPNTAPTPPGSTSTYELCYENETIQVDYVINAIGFNKHYTHTDTDTDTDTPTSTGEFGLLYQNLLQSGLVQCHMDGGLQCDFHTNRLLPKIGVTGDIGENGNNGDIGGLKLYGIGHLVCGTKLITSNLFNCLGDGEVAVKDYCKYI